MPIDSVKDLQDHIEMAIGVELSTVPPYLFAMYSIKDQRSEAALLLRSIVVEEMLHAALATNILLAVGGTPSYEGTKYVFQYPGDLPHHTPPLTLQLAPCSEDVIRNVFMRVEQPETHGAPAQADEFETLGQFYHALEIGITELSTRLDLFADPQIGAQLSDPGFYQPVEFDADDSGGLVGIQDVDSAIEAIEIIVHQGEGLSDERWADPDHQELTHYYKLLEIAEGRSPLGEVWPVRTDPRTADYPPELRVVSDLFNAAYRSMFLVMGRLFRSGSDQPQEVDALYGIMSDVLSAVGAFLVRQTLEDGSHAGPTFEIYEFSGDDAERELLALAETASANYPELTDVHAALSRMASGGE